jgi:hypothetical protein
VNNRLLHLGNALDILELSFGADTVLWTATSKALEDIPCFLLTANLYQPAGGLGEEPNGNEENQQEDDLEGDWKAPAEGGLATVDEREATRKKKRMLDLSLWEIILIWRIWEHTTQANRPEPHQRCSM